MSNYSSISRYYDSLNDHCPYEDYLSFITHCKDEFCSAEGAGILDAACGTGRLSAMLAAEGFEVTGFDLSEEELCVAEKNARDAGTALKLLCADMRYMRYPTKFPVCICTMDSVNYLLSKKDLSLFFDCVKHNLAPGGILIFDVNTVYRYENVYADNAYVLESEEALLAWQNEYNPRSKRCKFYLSLFALTRDGRYERSDEEHTQKYHSPKTLTEVFTKSGLELAGVFGNLDMSELKPTSEKAYFVLKNPL